MKKQSINWKAKCIAAENCAELLRIERDGEHKEREKACLDYLLLKSEVARRPIVSLEMKPKIIEKEVLPLWHVIFMMVMMIGYSLAFVFAYLQIQQLSEPILRPYAVTITKHDAPGLSECQDAWRGDERELKKLRRKCQ